MAKDIRINQNGNQIRLNDVEKIETSIDNGETTLWISEDDARLTVLEENRPNIYYPPPWACGFSRAEVSGFVPAEHLDEYPVLYVTENGIYQASNDSNGPYKGYSKIVVGVGINPEEIEILPDVSVETIDYPTAIRVVRMPDRTVWSEDDLIDYTGLQVYAYRDDGSVWTSPDYPTGLIPINELYLKPNIPGKYATANPDEDYGDHYMYPGEVFKYKESDSVGYYSDSQETIMILYKAVGLGPCYTIAFKERAVGDEPEKLILGICSSHYFEYFASGNSGPFYRGEAHDYTIANRTVYCVFFGGSTSLLPAGYVTAPIVETYSSPNIMWIICYGTHYTIDSASGVAPVSVQWTVPGTQTILETSFNLTIE